MVSKMQTCTRYVPQHAVCMAQFEKGQIRGPGQGISTDLLNGQQSGAVLVGRLTIVYADTHFYRAYDCARVICFLQGLLPSI